MKKISSLLGYITSIYGIVNMIVTALKNQTMLEFLKNNLGLIFLVIGAIILSVNFVMDFIEKQKKIAE